MLQKENRDGLLYALGAYLAWGLVPIFFKWLAPVDALEVLAHRIVWSVPVCLLLLALLGQMPALWPMFRDRTLLGKLALSALLVSGNWFIFVWAIGQDRILDTSLGYFINPLFTIALGVLVLNERLGRLKQAALLCAALGVGWQVVHQGALPWVSLALALTFGLYGLMRKQIVVGALHGLLIETLLLLPLALGFLLWRTGEGRGAFGAQGVGTDALLVLSGLVTVVPLSMFAAGARRLSLTALGFLQYISPSCSFLLAIFLYHEPFDGGRAFSFALIWFGLSLLALDSLRAARQQTPAD